MVRLAALLSLILPGLGHIVAGRAVTGFLLVLVFTAGAAGAVFRGVVLGNVPPLRDAGFLLPLMVAGAAWLVAQGGLVRGLLRPRSAAVLEKRDAHYREGMIAFARNNLDDAEANFRASLRLDPFDVDSMFQLATVLKHRPAGAGAARRWFKRCRRRDAEGKWAWEISRELSEL